MTKNYLIIGALSLSFSVNSADIAEIFQQSEIHDPQLSIAKYTLEASTEGKKQAFASFLPEVSSSFDKGFGKNKQTNSLSATLPSVKSRSDSWRVNISQTLYNHSNYQNYRISELEILKASSDYDVAYQDFVLRVAQTYFEMLGAKDNLVFTKSEEKAIQRQLDQAEQRYEVGLAAITDVHEARARFDSARAAVILAQNQVEDANEALFEIAQKYYSDLNQVPDEIDFSAFKLSPMESYQNLGIESNPNLISAKVNSDIAEKRIELNKSGHYPTLSASFSRSGSSSPGQIRNGFDDNGVPIQFPTGDTTSDGNSVGLTLSVPIYSGGRTSSQVRQSVFNHKAAMDRYEQTRRSTIRKIRNAYHGTLANISSVQARKLAMISAQSGLEATEAGYEVGTRTIVDVLNSQRSLYQAQRDYSKAKYDYFVQYLGLKRESGSLQEKDIFAINKILN